MMGAVLQPEDKVGGMAVHIGARVAAHAAPGEVLVSQTVRDLVAGSGIEFADRGVAELKGVPDRWRLWAVLPGSVLELHCAPRRGYVRPAAAQ